MRIKFDWDRSKRKGILSGDMFDDIREHFSVENDTARYQRYHNRFTPARKYCITPTGRFEPGLYFEIRKFLNQNNIPVKTHATEEFKKNIIPKYNITRPMFDSLHLTPRDYQSSIVDICLRCGRGTIVLATAGGKTLTIAYLLENIFKLKPGSKCLIVVPDLGLVNQTYSDFKEYGVHSLYSKWTGNDKLNSDASIIIANMGILQSAKSDINWIYDVDVVIIDEVHKLRKGNKINKILSRIKTQNKFGFTGTLPEESIDQWNIIGSIGPVLFEKDSYQLRKEKFVSNVVVQMLKLEYIDPPARKRSSNPTKQYREELEFLANNKFRNSVITQLSKNFDNNALIMIDYIDHGQKIYDQLSTQLKDKKVYFIRGEVAVADRDRVKKLMETRTDIVVIAISKIFSTGINIKNLHYIVFAGGGKAKVKIIQSIGRGLRLHKDKEKVVIVDIADQLTYGYRHMQKRVNLYKSERIEYGTKKIKEKKEKE